MSICLIDTTSKVGSNPTYHRFLTKSCYFRTSLHLNSWSFIEFKNWERNLHIWSRSLRWWYVKRILSSFWKSSATEEQLSHTVTKLDFSSKKAQNLLTRFLKFLGPKPFLHYVGSYSKKKLQGLFHKKIHNFNFSETYSLLP